LGRVAYPKSVMLFTVLQGVWTGKNIDIKNK